MAPADPSSVPAGAARFPPTLWSIVLAAGHAPSPRAEEALATLCRTYWYPLYAYLRRAGRSAHDAEDLAQAFFLHLLQTSALGHVSREKGRFRSFLLASLKHFLVDQGRKLQAQKRGGDANIISLDGEGAERRYQDEPSTRLDPERLFERRWATTVLNGALTRLETECAAAGKEQRFEELQVFLTGDSAPISYAEVGRRLRMSEGAVKVAVLRLRQRYRELVRAEIAQTVATEEQAEEEMQHLQAALRPE